MLKLSHISCQLPAVTKTNFQESFHRVINLHDTANNHSAFRCDYARAIKVHWPNELRES